MADQEEEDLRAALRMSMQQHSPPEPKRSKPGDSPLGPPISSSEESPEVKDRRLQRELMAAAAEKRMLAGKSYSEAVGLASKSEKKDKEFSVKDVNLGKEMLEGEANQLFSMVFGDQVSREILAQWSNQGIRFSPDPETSMGLVQHEGGPCGVLATIQGQWRTTYLGLPLRGKPKTSTFWIMSLKKFSKSSIIGIMRTSQTESTHTQPISALQHAYVLFVAFPTAIQGC